MTTNQVSSGMPCRNTAAGCTDLFQKIHESMGPLGQYADVAEGYYIFPELEGPPRNRMSFNGKEMICWSINDYLGLADHPEIRKADAEAAGTWGLAHPMGARTMTGETRLHKQLEQELAKFVHKPAALLLNYGYQGMVSLIDALVSPHDVIVYDSESHACIMDGIRLHLGKKLSYKHNNMESLEDQLAAATRLAAGKHGGILLITEGVFGMRGDQGRLLEIAAMKERYGFRLLVDDAHGFGTMGADGSGTGTEQGVQDSIDIYFGTFAKSMALIGAFVAGEPSIIRYLKYNLRSQVFAKSLPMAMVQGALTRLDLIRKEPGLRIKLWENVKLLQEGLRKAGFNIGITKSAVTPVYLEGSVQDAGKIVYDLRENYRVFCSMVIYPIIPKGEILLRLIPTASHTKEDIEQTIAAFAEISEKLVTGYYHDKTYNTVAGF